MLYKLKPRAQCEASNGVHTQEPKWDKFYGVILNIESSHIDNVGDVRVSTIDNESKADGGGCFWLRMDWLEYAYDYREFFHDL